MVEGGGILSSQCHVASSLVIPPTSREQRYSLFCFVRVFRSFVSFVLAVMVVSTFALWGPLRQSGITLVHYVARSTTAHSSTYSYSYLYRSSGYLDLRQQ